MFNFLGLGRSGKPPATATVVDLGTTEAKAAVVDLMTFNPTLLGFARGSYPEGALLSGLVSDWGQFVGTVGEVLRTSSLTVGFIPQDLVYSLSGEFIKSFTVDLLIHRRTHGVIRGQEKLEIKKEVERLLTLEVQKEFLALTGNPQGQFKVIQRSLVGLETLPGTRVDALTSIHEPEFKASFAISFISRQTERLLMKLTQDLKKRWFLTCDQTFMVGELLKRQDPGLSAAFLDLGGQVSDVVIFYRGRVLGERTIPLGGKDLTELLSQAFRLPLAEAEIKKKEGNLLTVENTIEYWALLFQGLEKALKEISAAPIPATWPLYFWGGAAELDSLRSQALEKFLKTHPQSILRNMSWQKLSGAAFKANFSSEKEKPDEFQAVLATVSLIPQRYATSEL